MEQRKQGIMVASQAQNPIKQFQARFKELENGFQLWLPKQSLAVEAAVVTATDAAHGVVIGAFLGTLTANAPSALAMTYLKQVQALAGGPFVLARNFAVMTGVHGGISCVLKRLRGEEDVRSCMAAAFGSGAMFSLVSGMGGPNKAAHAVFSGIFFALSHGGLFQIGQPPPVEDVHYAKTRHMLNNLGLLSYEKNFKKGLLTDNTLPLLTDSTLRDVRIPPGARLLILDHIQRDLDPKEKRGSRN
ncbi:hypothetical protein VNO80_18908 [Phaseolus coccineus]|uniref:SAM domain-containing protein n=1 Tax=Phaseolus coccineus TaxID=3886 RepID=A0AAN9MF75_PHACN